MARSAALATWFSAGVCLLLGLSACSDASQGAIPFEAPIITPAERWDAYPMAQVVGELKLRGGCLLVGGDIVFWPNGTTWDEAAQAVVFERGSPAPLGAIFDGGGGFYEDPDVVFARLLGDDGGRAIERCRTKTGRSTVVFAYPSDILN